MKNKNQNTKSTSSNRGRNNYAKKPQNKGFSTRGTARGREDGNDFESDKFPWKKVNPAKGNNDPEWYFKSSTLLNDVASFSYAQPLGTDLHPSRVFNPVAPGFLTGGANAIPGLMSIELAPSPGVAVDAQDPINLAAQNIYSFVRYKNSGAANYDAPDLMLYLLAMDSVYMVWNWIKRIYGSVSTYSAMNRYKPKAYAMANGVDIEDLYSNLADFRAYINMAADRISAFCVPAVFTYMVRHSWLFSNIYKDADTTKAQEYMYVPSFAYMYDETSSPKGGILTPINILFNAPATPYKFADLRTILDTMINHLQYSEDIGIMSGDILKAYGDGELYRISHIEPDFRVDSVYNRGVLSQIENSRLASIFKQGNDLTIFNITQDPNTNFIKYRPTVTIPDPFNERLGHYLNFHWDSPTPQDVIESSRLLYTTSTTTSASQYIVKLDNCGSELMLGGKIFYFAQSDKLNTPYREGAPLNLYSVDLQITLRYNDKMSGENLCICALYAWLWQAFDWAPPYTATIEVASGNRYMTLGYRDWDVYTVVQNQNIVALNLLALQSEFNIPN